TVNKVTKQLGFQLRIPRKKPFLTPFAKIRRKYWSRKRLSWTKMDWRKCVWLDEAKMQYLKDKNLSAGFKSGSVGVEFWGAIAYGRRTPLIR
ncbi:hypothetical protein B9Z19DRAFT_958129, partial [Tuber borchii]